MKPLAPELVTEVRELNVVLDEDDDTITAVAPCPTSEHRPSKVAPDCLVRFECPHGESTNLFCAPCTAVRRAGVWACQGYKTGNPVADCPGALVVEVRTLHPTTRQKATP